MAVTQKHPYHLVDPSPWPLTASTASFSTAATGNPPFDWYNDVVTVKIERNSEFISTVFSFTPFLLNN